MPRYLQQRRRRWYALLDIPKALRPAFDGKPRFVQSLETESLSIAERRCPPLVARWKALIETARNGDPTPLVELQEEAVEWRELLQQADADTRQGYEYVLEDKAERMDAAHEGQGAELFKVATGRWKRTAEWVEEWLSSLDNEPKTIDMKRKDLSRFTGKFRLTKDVRRKAVQQWAHELQQKEELKPATVRRIISACRGYWGYLQLQGVASDNVSPFREVVPRNAKKSKAEIAARRKAFSPSDVAQLLTAAKAKGDNDLAHLIWLGMWTGCRIEELCGLTVAKVAPDRIIIEDAKSEAGWREVPLHSKLLRTVEYLTKVSNDGFLLSGLTNNKYGDRSNAVGKRFGRLKSGLGFGGDYVFHSIRKTVVTQFDAAGIPEAVSARIVGHDIPTMTYGVYSGGAPFDVKKDAIEVLRYPINDDVSEWLQRRYEAP